MENTNNNGGKEYLVCITIETNSGYDKVWELFDNGADVYNYVRSLYIDEDLPIDIDNSFILSTNTKLRVRQPLFSFMKYVHQINPQDDFDISDYVLPYVANDDGNNEQPKSDDNALKMDDLVNRDTSPEV